MAARAAEQIERYVSHNLDLLEAVAADLQLHVARALAAGAHPPQLRAGVPGGERADALRSVGAAARLEPADAHAHAPHRDAARAPARRPSSPPVQVDEARLPFTEVTLRLDASDRARELSGRRAAARRAVASRRSRARRRAGFALLVDETGRLLAHGNPDDKPRVARGEYLTSHPLIAKQGADRRGDRRATPRGRPHRCSASCSPIAALGWKVVIEQPTGRRLRARHAPRALPGAYDRAGAARDDHDCAAVGTQLPAPDRRR